MIFWKRLQISTAAVCLSCKNFAPSGALIWPSALAFALTDLFYPPLQTAIKLCADKPFKYNRLCKEPNAAHLGTCLALPIGRPLWNYRIVTTTQGLAANERGLLVADEKGRTTRPGIFASGDVVNGARTVVEAVAHSKVVAESMHEYMQSLPKEDSTQ